MVTLLFVRLFFSCTVMSLTFNPFIGGDTECLSNYVIEDDSLTPIESKLRKDYIVVEDPSIIRSLDARIQKNDYKISDEEIITKYDEFVHSKKDVVSTDDYYSLDMMNEFVDQAVTDGLIDDTPIQRAAFSKNFLRANFKTVAACGQLAGYTTAADLLNHSLQDYPANLSYTSNSSYAHQIQFSSECNSIVNGVRNYVRGKNITYYTCNSHICLCSTTDLHLAYHNVDYTVTARKSGNRWNLSIVFSDTYDFDYQAWSNSMTDNQAVTIINNYAAFAQSQGAIVPYNINVTVSTYFQQ